MVSVRCRMQIGCSASVNLGSGCWQWMGTFSAFICKGGRERERRPCREAPSLAMKSTLRSLPSTRLRRRLRTADSGCPKGIRQGDGAGEGGAAGDSGDVETDRRFAARAWSLI